MTPYEKLRQTAQRYLDMATISTDKDLRRRFHEKSLLFAQRAEDLLRSSNNESPPRESDDQ